MTRTTKFNPTPALSFGAAFLAAFLTASTAFAEDNAAATADPHEWALWTSCSVFFGIVIVFLVVSHRSAARELGRLDAIEKRLDVAERTAASRAK